MDFTGKVVLVTGAGAGMGREVALRFARLGAKVAVNSLTPSAAGTADQIRDEGYEALFLQGDVSLAATAEALIAKTVETLGRLDIVINNAGVVVGGSVDTTTEEDWDRCMAVNAKGTFLVSKYAVQQMKKQGGGVIVHNASVVAIKGVANRLAYSASKGAILSMTKAMAADHIKDHIRVNCVCPGTVETPSLWDRINSEEDPQAAYARFCERQQMGRLGTVEELAEAILFAASDEVRFMTGANIVVDGGLSI